MIAIPGNVREWIATGHTDMRRGFPSLARLVQVRAELTDRAPCTSFDVPQGASSQKRDPEHVEIVR